MVLSRRVDIEIPPLGILCIRRFPPLSIGRVPHYSAVGDISLPLTEPDLQISHIRLFSYPHFTGTIFFVPARYELEFRLHPVPISMHGGCLPLALRVAANPFE